MCYVSFLFSTHEIIGSNYTTDEPSTPVIDGTNGGELYESTLTPQVTITCTSDGNPGPKLYIQIGNGGTVQEGPSPLSYSYTPVVADDGKEIKCIANNTFGSAMSTQIMSIQQGNNSIQFRCSECFQCAINCSCGTLPNCLVF